MHTKWLVIFHSSAGTHTWRADSREEAREMVRRLQLQGREARTLELRESKPVLTLLRAA